MIIPESVKLFIAAIAIGGACLSGWTVRGWQCDSAMAGYQNEQHTQAQAQREAVQKIEAKQEAATSQSTQRIDQQQAEQQKETVYVEKQVIQYRDRWRGRDCKRPAEWVQLYNRSLFGSVPAVPEASPTRSAPTGPGL